MNKDLNYNEICRAICHAQEIICDLYDQNKIEISEWNYLKKAFDSLQEVFESQFAKSCKSLADKIVAEVLGVNEKVFKED